MLKFELSEVPAELASYYDAVGDGKFRLKVEGAVSATDAEEAKEKVKQFRENNIALQKQVEKLAHFEKMFATGEFSSEKLNSKIEEQAALKAETMKTAYETQVAELTEKLTGTSSKLESIVLNNAVSAAALKNGVSETALPDVYARAREAFKVIDGDLSANGILDAKGKPLTVDSWMATLAEKAPHLFNASRGAGANKPGRPVAQEFKLSAVDRISSALAKRR